MPTRCTASPGTARFDWEALDAWYEEDEQVYVHPRNPYVRVDALPAHRHVRVELDGYLLADSTGPVLVFETGLLTRYYVQRTDVAFERLVPTGTRTARVEGRTPKAHQDVAWSYAFPTRQVLPIAGLVAFYEEKVDIEVDRVLLPRAHTRFV